MRIDPAPLHAHIKTAKRMRWFGVGAIGLCVYIAADAIYDPSRLMIEHPWVQALIVTLNICCSVLNWNNNVKNEAWIIHTRETIKRIEAYNRIFG